MNKSNQKEERKKYIDRTSSQITNLSSSCRKSSRKGSREKMPRDVASEDQMASSGTILLNQKQDNKSGPLSTTSKGPLKNLKGGNLKKQRFSRHRSPEKGNEVHEQVTSRLDAPSELNSQKFSTGEPQTAEAKLVKSSLELYKQSPAPKIDTRRIKGGKNKIMALQNSDLPPEQSQPKAKSDLEASQSQFNPNGVDLEKEQTKLTQPQKASVVSKKRGRKPIVSDTSKLVSTGDQAVKTQLKQKTCSPVKTNTRTRNPRKQGQDLNYQIFFEDYDGLSEQEELKRKREQKRNQKLSKPCAMQQQLQESNKQNKTQKEEAPKPQKMKTKKEKQRKTKEDNLSLTEGSSAEKPSEAPDTNPHPTDKKCSIQETKDVKQEELSFDHKRSKQCTLLHDPSTINIFKVRESDFGVQDPVDMFSSRAGLTRTDKKQKPAQIKAQKAIDYRKRLSKTKCKATDHENLNSKEEPASSKQDNAKEEKAEGKQETWVQETSSNLKIEDARVNEKKVESTEDTQSEGPQVVGGTLIQNPFAKKIRSQALDFTDFNNLTTENNTYKPAQIQKLQIEQNSRVTTHFIHKKQSSCNIKRVSGVSYVVKSESKQLDVRENYEKLAPLVIQGSYHLPRLDDQTIQEKIEAVCHDYLFSDHSYFLCTAFETGNEIAMKNYLLKPHRRQEISKGNYFLIKGGLDQCWKFIKDKNFLCIHFIYDPQTLIRNIPLGDVTDRSKVADFIFHSDISLGILTKRGNASVKSMLKAYKLETRYQDHLQSNPQKNSNENEEEEEPLQSTFDIANKIGCQGAIISGINTIALMSRVELYVDEARWRKADQNTQVCLNTLINRIEESISSTLLYWNKQRTAVSSSSQLSLNNGNIQELPTIWRVSSKPKEQKNISGHRAYNEWQKASLDGLVLPEILASDFYQQSQQLKPESSPLDIMSSLQKSQPTPITVINTRDCFVYDLYVKETVLNMGKSRKNVMKKEYYFRPGCLPENYKQVVGLPQDANMEDCENLRVGITTYEDFYQNEEMKNMEHMIEETERKSLNDDYLPMTAQKTFAGNTLKRTKFFFGFRYMWTKTQLQEPLSNVAAGVRGDVSQPPVWMKTQLEDPLVETGIVEKNFINSVALNVYHDGSEGLAQHFDDATRFKQPIYTLRLFSDSRLSFGSQYYGFCNGAFTIPLPRGCICVMEEGSYSANGVKHCIRPCDMTGKSSAVILRQMHPNVVSDATKYDRNVDLPMWLSSLSLEDKSVAYYKQKDLEALELEKVANGQAGSDESPKEGNPKKRGPKTGVVSLEKKIMKQNQKDVKDIRKLMDEMIRRLEIKQREAQKCHHKFEVIRKANAEGNGQVLFKSIWEPRANQQSSTGTEELFKQSAVKGPGNDSPWYSQHTQETLISTPQVQTPVVKKVFDHDGDSLRMLPVPPRLATMSDFILPPCTVNKY